MNHRIYPILTGHFTVSFGNDRNLKFPRVQDIPSFIFLIEDEEGEIILVDTGFDLDHIPGSDSGGIMEGKGDILSAVRNRGFNPSDIKTIIQTHLHWDHTAGLSSFKDAQIIVQASEIEGLFNLRENEETSFCPAHWMDSLERFRLIEGTHQVRPGIELIRTGRHTEGHQIVRVKTADATAVLLGDSPFTYEWLWTMIPDELWIKYRNGEGSNFFWPDGVMDELKLWYNRNKPPAETAREDMGMKEIKKLGNVHIFSHDPELIKKDFF